MSKITVSCPQDMDKLYGLHPKVYFSLSDDEPVAHCPYCQKEFNINDL